MACSNPISPSLNSSPNSSTSSPTITQSNHHEKDHQSTPATFKTRTNLLRNNSNRSHHHRSFSQGTVPLSPSSNSSTIIKSPTSSTITTTTTFNEQPSSNYIYVQPASPLYEPNKSTSQHHQSNLENLHQNSNHPSVDPSIDHLTVRSRRARLPYFTPLIQPQPISFPRRSPPKSAPPTSTSKSKSTATTTATTATTSHLVRVHDYAHPPSNQPVHYISTSNPTTSSSSPPHDPTNLNPEGSSPIKRPLHQKAKSEAGTSMMRIELGTHSNSTGNLLSIDETNLDLGTPMLRKKSGEVVRSSLKETRAKSAPATPTGPKYVHFDSHLEHVKHFLSQQRPAAVSRDGSPIETETEGEEEFPFPMTISRTRLVLELINFPIDPDMNAKKNSSEVYLRWIELSNDGKTLKGQVQVKNLSFQKLVAIRFTFDSWQTVSEVMAEYIESIQNGQFDRFTFSIRLVDQLARIEDRKMYIAIRYTTDGREIWDNNLGANYDVRFKKVRSTGGGAGGGINQHSFKPLSPSVPHHPLPDLSSLSTALPVTSVAPLTPIISSTSSPLPTIPSQAVVTPSTAPYQWSVTTEVQAQDRMAELRAELDRLVGDDLGLSMPSQPTFKSSSNPSFLKDESPKRETIKKPDSISAGNHIKLNALTPFASRYDFTSSLKQAVTSPRFEERRWSFGTASGGVGGGGFLSQGCSPSFDSSTTSTTSNSTILNDSTTITTTDSVPRSELFLRTTTPEVELGFVGAAGVGTGGGGSIGGNGNGQAVLESLRAFQEQKLQGGHNLEPSDYGELVQNFCWGGNLEEEETHKGLSSFNPTSLNGISNELNQLGIGLIPTSNPIPGSSNSFEGYSNERNEQIGILLETVKARFGSPTPTTDTNRNQKTIGLGIIDRSGI